jgi:mannan endo-1,4-beta-mannosidase
MKFLIPLFMTSVVSAAALPSANLLASSATNQPACSYPIGTSNGKNAKVSGRLFEIDGKVEYFAGMFDLLSRWQSLNFMQEVTLGGSHI